MGLNKIKTNKRPNVAAYLPKKLKINWKDGKWRVVGAVKGSRKVSNWNFWHKFELSKFLIPSKFIIFWHPQNLQPFLTTSKFEIILDPLKIHKWFLTLKIYNFDTFKIYNFDPLKIYILFWSLQKFNFCKL